MWKKFLKKSSWTDIVVSLVFILLGVMLIANPEVITAAISVILGCIIIGIGVLRFIDYLSTGKQDNYLLAISIVLIIAGIIVMICTEPIISIFRIIIALWIIYSGIMNLQTTIIWKDYKSKVWLTTLILAIAMIIAGIYVLVNDGVIIQTIGVAIVIYGVIDVIENLIFIKKVDDYLE